MELLNSAVKQRMRTMLRALSGIFLVQPRELAGIHLKKNRLLGMVTQPVLPSSLTSKIQHCLTIILQKQFQVAPKNQSITLFRFTSVLLMCLVILNIQLTTRLSSIQIWISQFQELLIHSQVQSLAIQLHSVEQSA